jgi:alkylation response protein AidB-like acyl-CoA dehydrogenase
MDFALSEEQRLLAASVAGTFEQRLPMARVREIAADESGFDADLWRTSVELGLPAMLVEERFGGGGLGMLDAMVVASGIGHAAAPLPFLGPSVLAPVLVQAAGSDAQAERLLAPLAGGEGRLAVALTETFRPSPESGLEASDTALAGRALFVPDAAMASAFLVAIDASSVAVVAADAPGLTVTDLPTVDRTRRFAELTFDDTPVLEWLGKRGEASKGIERAIAAGRIAVAADILGCADRALAMAVAYAGERKQFGRVIGSFQAVKHMCAEMAAAIEPARSLLWYAAHAFDRVPSDSLVMADHAKALLSEVGRRVAKVSTEVHGGVGFTEEYDLHLWFKRLEVNRQLLGGPSVVRAHAAALANWS